MRRLLLPPRRAGFTLIEVLIGMVIALIGMVLMFQAMTSWDARKRTTSAGSDAQISGSIGMFMLERDLKLAGYGFGNSVAMGCMVSAYDSTLAAPGLFSFRMAPVVITDGAAGAPDTVAALYGSGTTMSSSQTFSNLSATSIRLNSRTGMQRGDLLIAADAGNVCGLFEVTGDANADGVSIDIGTAAYINYVNNQNVQATTTLAADALALLQAKFLNNSGTPRYNDNTEKGVGVSGAAFNLGTAPQLNFWSIANRRSLVFANTLANQVAATEVADGIVDLQAEYGVDTDSNGVVDLWSVAVPVWTQVLAIRIGLLARSQQFERVAISNFGPCTTDPLAVIAGCQRPVWAGGPFVMTNLDGAADTNPGNANDWRHYRYRVYDTVIPLRNVLWGLE